jgi:hypothetical protein
MTYKPGYSPKHGLANCGFCGELFPGGAAPSVCPHCGKEADWGSFPAAKAGFAPPESAKWSIGDAMPREYGLAGTKNGGYTVRLPPAQTDAIKDRAARVLGRPVTAGSGEHIFKIVSVTPNAPYMAEATATLPTADGGCCEITVLLYLADHKRTPHLAGIRPLTGRRKRA